jgi:RNA polymerase sigma factor (sigma-70 family)
VREGSLAIALLGEAIGPRRDPRSSRGWLARLGHELDDHYADELLLPFAAAGGVELRGLLRATADPLAAVLRGALGPEARRMRWAIALGAAEPGETLMDDVAGEAFELARGALERARRHHDALILVTSDPAANGLLEALGPVLGDTLARLTARQRTVARLMLVEGRRQAEVAEELGVSRATISVNVARSRLRSMTRLVAATNAIFASGFPAPTEPLSRPRPRRVRAPA